MKLKFALACIIFPTFAFADWSGSTDVLVPHYYLDGYAEYTISEPEFYGNAEIDDEVDVVPPSSYTDVWVYYKIGNPYHQSHTYSALASVFCEVDAYDTSADACSCKIDFGSNDYIAETDGYAL